MAESSVCVFFTRILTPARPDVESLLANGSGQKFISRDYHTTGADLHYSLKTLCRRNFYVAFGTFVGI